MKPTARDLWWADIEAQREQLISTLLLSFTQEQIKTIWGEINPPDRPLFAFLPFLLRARDGRFLRFLSAYITLVKQTEGAVIPAGFYSLLKRGEELYPTVLRGDYDPETA